MGISFLGRAKAIFSTSRAGGCPECKVLPQNQKSAAAPFYIFNFNILYVCNVILSQTSEPIKVIIKP